MNFLSLIESKRDGLELKPEQLREIVSSYTAGSLPDYQMAAFLMAVFFRGLSASETRALTLAMRDSGDRLSFPADSRPLVDKHSTGGVGDKVSLPLAPLLACLGFRVPMISGRGLGITGGTLDKLDSIPGFRTSLAAGQIVEIVQGIGCVICGQTERMAPADKGLYALRDVTGTVPSLPLIVSSILSKKLAEGVQAMVLDVKFGAAAFMPTLAKARELAHAMVSLANECGTNTRALLTNMDAPLGRAAGNWLEVKEAEACLNPKPARTRAKDSPDLRGIVLACAAHLLVQTGKAATLEMAGLQAEQCLASGEPQKKWHQMLAAQGANLDAFRRKLNQDHSAGAIVEIKSSQKGWVSRADARLIGEVVRDLGAGRLTKESAVHHEVGVDCLAKPGDEVSAGSVLARVHAMDQRQADEAGARLKNAFLVSPEPAQSAPLIAEIV